MNIEELEAQLDELDMIAQSSNVSVSFDASTGSIRATQRLCPPNDHEYDRPIPPPSSECISFGSVERSGFTTNASASLSNYQSVAPPLPDRPDKVRISAEPLLDTLPGNTTLSDYSEFTEPPASQNGCPGMKSLAEIDVSNVEIPDAFIDERRRLAFDRREAGYLPDVKLVGFGASGIWEVAEDYSYEIDYFAVGRQMTDDARRRFYALGGPPFHSRVPHLATITAKKGFQFDRASIPRIFWVLISKDDLSNVPPLFHDLLYRYAGRLPVGWVSPFTEFSRTEADRLFFHLMERSGVSSWRLHVAYQAVAQFSSFAWGKRAF